MADFNFEEGPETILINRFQSRPAGSGVQVVLQSGSKQYGFIFDWVLAKKLAKYFKQVVDEVEGKNNIKFDDRLDNEPIKSEWLDSESKSKK
jgi:hypothetical protein